jgi:hypothetical protein
MKRKYGFTYIPPMGENVNMEEIKWGLNYGNAAYNSVRNVLFSRLLSKNVKFKILVDKPEGKRPLGRPRRGLIWLRIGTSRGKL